MTAYRDKLNAGDYAPPAEPTDKHPKSEKQLSPSAAQRKTAKTKTNTRG